MKSPLPLSFAHIFLATSFGFLSQASGAADTPTLDGIIAGEIAFGSSERQLFAELRELPPTEVVARLLKAAAATESPAEAMFLIGFCKWIKDELAYVADAAGDDPSEFFVDIPQTKALWEAALKDRRTDGFTFAGRPYSVADIAAETLEFLMVAPGDEDLLWDLWPSIGGHCLPWFQKRAEARLAGGELPHFPDPLPVDPASRKALHEAFLTSDKGGRSAWLHARSPDEILALKEIASADDSFGGALLGSANRILTVLKLEMGMASPSEWKPESDAFDRELLNEIVAYASHQATTGKWGIVSILREGGFGGIRLVETSLDAGGDTVRNEAENGTRVGGAIESLPFVNPFCKGAVVVLLSSEAPQYSEHSAVWWVGTKSDLPDPEAWEETLKNTAIEQRELLDHAMEIMGDPTLGGDEVILEFWYLPTAKG